MKKLFLLLIFIAGFVSLNAQNPDDLVISGYVTNSNGLAVANQQVCVASDSLNPNPFNQCVNTNSNGWYTITVINGSITGPNQTYKVFTTGCNNSFMHQYVSNNQGTVDAATVNFTNVDIAAVGGTITGGTTPLTLGASTGPMVLSNNVGTVIKWEKRLNSGIWTTINFSGNTYSETPSLCGTWEYRAVVQNGNCQAFSSSVSIVVICQTTCDAGFTFQISGLNVHFYSTNTDTTVQHSWTFSNGSTSTIVNPIVNYPTAGTYTVCHYVYASGTSCIDSVCQTITIDSTTNCMVTYSYNTQNLLPNQVQFNGILTSGTGAYTWYWSFGDGTTGQGQNPLHQYAQSGNYSVCVYLHLNSGTILCQYCDSIYVPVAPAGCQAYFTFAQSGTAVSFNSNNSIFPSGTVLYNWSFGDSTSSTLANPIHTYTTNGTYNVCLTITTTNNNCTDTYCQTITIGQSNICNISFTFAQNPNGAYIFTPTFPSTILNPQFVWHFGDGQTSNLQQPVHAYVNPGLYSVCLTISGSGISCTYCDSINVVSSPNACNASFTYQISGLTVTFTSPMINMLTNHYWSFGDGTSSTLANPTVTYAAAGVYTVCHHVWNTSCSDSICQTITVGTTINCNVSFTFNTQNLLPGQVQFFGLITPNTGAYYWHWDFGDGQSANGQQNPIHQYAQSGSYMVCVNIMQSNGTITCSYCDTIYVPVTPSILCSANFTFQQSGAIVHFFSNNSGTPSSTTMNYFWDFGDGSSSSLVNPIHTFTTAGTYTVCLTVVDSVNNCTDQYCQTIIIGNNTTCQASFQFTYGSLFNVAFFGHFTPLSTATQWYWSFGDSTFANIQNPIHNYSGPGTYQVCLTVVSSNCPATTYCQTITVQGNTPGCQAYFTYQVNNADVHFTALNTSSNPNQFLYYFWNFGDSTTSNLQNPVHTYTAMGTYTVCLTITDSLNGCSDQFCQTITLGNNVQLSGQIFAGNNPADMGTVYLLSVTPGSSNGVLPVASTPILAGGYYQFSNIPYGQYLIQAHLSQNSIYYFGYLPTYYGDVLYWSQATFVSIGQVNLTVQYDIHLIGTNLNNGNGQISGNVLQGTGNKSTVEDILVVLLDEFDVPVTYTYSDVNGYFEFDNLALGTYKIFAEIWGKDPISASVILDSNNPTVDNVIITVNDLNVISSLEGINAFYFDFIGNPYPNPTTDNINMEICLKQNAHLAINVYNIMGVSVYEQNSEYNSGVHRMNFNTNNLPAGLYYIDIVADSKFRVSKVFNKIK